jgi:hypothetical protein
MVPAKGLLTSLLPANRHSVFCNEHSLFVVAIRVYRRSAAQLTIMIAELLPHRSANDTRLALPNP